MKCQRCTSTLVYTTYIRTLKRSAVTHHTKQAYIPAGLLCLECAQFSFHFPPEELKNMKRRFHLVDRADKPPHTVSGVEEEPSASSSAESTGYPRRFTG